MSRISYVNGCYVDHREAAVHVEDRGYQFSDGVYEYIAFFNGKLLDGGPHLARMERSLKELAIPMPVAMRALPIVINELIERNARRHGGLYIQVTRGVARRDHVFPKRTKPALVMTVCAPKLPKEREVREGVAVVTHPDLRWQRRDIKSVSLLPNILAKQAAAEKQAREAWLIEEKGIVTEGAVSNAYIVSPGGELITHPADERILNGITREAVLKLARKAGIRVSECAFSLNEARQAAEAFMTSTSIGVLPVAKIDGEAVGTGHPGEVTRALQDLYAAHVLKQTGYQL